MPTRQYNKRPNQNEYHEFLIQIAYRPYFKNYLQGCIKSSYLDVCRTMKGVGDHTHAKQAAHDFLNERFQSFKKMNNIKNQKSFDRWHKETCEGLIEKFKVDNFIIYYGQAQKWVNMTFKSIYVCGSKRIPDYEEFYNYCHLPIDNIVLDRLGKTTEFNKSKTAWSQWDYKTYNDCREKLRNLFPSDHLLNVEFRIWLEGKNNS